MLSPINSQPTGPTVRSLAISGSCCRCPLVSMSALPRHTRVFEITSVVRSRSPSSYAGLEARALCLVGLTNLRFAANRTTTTRNGFPHWWVLDHARRCGRRADFAPTGFIGDHFQVSTRLDRNGDETSIQKSSTVEYSDCELEPHKEYCRVLELRDGTAAQYW